MILYSIQIAKGDYCDMYYKIYIDNKVILDCNYFILGVLWEASTEIPGSADTVAMLRKLVCIALGQEQMVQLCVFAFLLLLDMPASMQKKIVK